MVGRLGVAREFQNPHLSAPRLSLEHHTGYTVDRTDPFDSLRVIGKNTIKYLEISPLLPPPKAIRNLRTR